MLLNLLERTYYKKNKTASTSRFLNQQRKTCGFLFRNKIQCNYKEKSVLDLALGSSQPYSMNEVYILTTDKRSESCSSLNTG